MHAALAIVVSLLSIDPGSVPDVTTDGGIAPEPPAARPSMPVDDAGFAIDAGDLGVLIERSAPALDGGQPVRPEPGEPLPLRLRGARVVPSELYRGAVHLPAHAAADDATAQVVRQQLLDYLHAAGFELASVNVQPAGRGLDVEIDEGRIERIVLVGALSFQMIQFKLAVALPGDVFNRPLLDEQVRAIALKLQLPALRWELVRVSEVPHRGPQATQLPGPMDLEVFGDRLIHERRPYEVRVIFPELNGTGFGIDVRSSYLDGFELGLNYRERDLFTAGDQLWTAASAGVAARERLDTYRLYPELAKVAPLGRYDFPTVFSHLRPNLWVQGEYLTRQRRDLGIERYDALIADAAFQTALELGRGLMFQGGLGFEWRRLFDFNHDAGVPVSPGVGLYDRKRPFFRFTQVLVFDPDVLRWDRRHTLQSELRYYFPVPNQTEFGWTDVRYQWVHGFGWHDFWVKGRGYVSWGDVSFHDELSVGEFLRSLFGDQYTRAGLALQLEFRFSVVRDLFKLSLFHDLALFAVQPDRTQPKLLAQLADGFGPGAHLLLQDLFQVDMYAAFGFRREGQFNFGLALQIDKAF